MQNDRLLEIFSPQYIRRVNEFEKFNNRLAYYTSIDIAEKILGNCELWMRNAGDMNDYREVKYGEKILLDILYGNMKKDVVKALEENTNLDINEIETIFYRFNNEMISWIYNTYITSFSEMEMGDNDGRLSMWRGYGRDAGVALVFDVRKMQNAIGEEKIKLSPVEYYTECKVEKRICEIIDNIKNSGGILKKSSTESILSSILNALRYAVVSIKHPGFEEEKEWRLVAHANDLNLDVEKINGVIQPIYKLKICNCALAEGLEKVIMAPSTPMVTWKAFIEILCEKLGFSKEEANNKVFISSIPYR